MPELVIKLSITFFEDDPTQVEVTYPCQDGTVPDTKKGFFDMPQEEENWPKCLQGTTLDPVHLSNQTVPDYIFFSSFVPLSPRDSI